MPEQTPTEDIKWHEVTWYSKLGALILFVAVVPSLAFYIGMQYQGVIMDTQYTNQMPTQLPGGRSIQLTTETISTTKVASDMSGKPTCTLTADKTEVQAGVESYNVTWTSTNATYAIWNYPNDQSWRRPSQGSEAHKEFDGTSGTHTYYFYGPGGSTNCSITIKINPTRTITTFPAPLVKLEVGGTVMSADGKYSLMYISDDGASGLTVSVKTPSGEYKNVHVADPNGGQKFGSGATALNVSRCGSIGDGREEFTFSLGNDPLPECVSRMG